MNFLDAQVEYAATAPAPRNFSTAPSASKVEAKALAFGEAHQDVLTWITARVERSNFAASLFRGLTHYGSLTERQVAAVRKIIADDAAKAAPAAAAAPSAANVAGPGFVSLGAALLKAKASGLKHPAIIMGGVCFKLAKADGVNAGSIYVTAGKAYGSAYFGKISEAGAFQASRECDAETRATIAQICADPLAQVVAHGRKTGNCACCNRELTDAESVARGIGPICFERYFG